LPGAGMWFEGFVVVIGSVRSNGPGHHSLAGAWGGSVTGRL
jgi:hypothetical protein